MESLQLICENRLKNVLQRDKNENPLHILSVLKSDMLLLLSNYMDIKADSLDIDICVLENGTYKLLIEGYSKRLRVAKHV